MWADLEPELAFTSRDTVIGLISARHGWEVPGRLSWGGAANYDLDGAHHVAVLRHWEQRYGAELVRSCATIGRTRCRMIRVWRSRAFFVEGRRCGPALVL